MQPTGSFSPPMPTALAATQPPAQGVQLGEKRKKKIKRIKPQQPVECFLAPGSSNASLLGECLPWLALAASSGQWGFLSSGRQLDFGQRLGVTGMSLTTARWYFSPDAVCLVHSHHPCTSLLHNCCVLTSGVGAALHPDVEVCAQQQVTSCAFTSLTPPSHGHKSRADAVFTARHPERFVQPLNPKSAQNPPEDKPRCAPRHLPWSKQITQE